MFNLGKIYKTLFSFLLYKQKFSMFEGVFFLFTIDLKLFSVWNFRKEQSEAIMEAVKSQKKRKTKEKKKTKKRKKKKKIMKYRSLRPLGEKKSERKKKEKKKKEPPSKNSLTELKMMI